MFNRAKYGQSMNLSPVTAWTSIARVSAIESAERTASLQKLVDDYDGPIQKLFEAIVGEDVEKALDWKQDFLISHMLTGKVFKDAKPKGRFRTYLAVAIKNYVTNRRKAESAQKRRASDGARPFSQVGKKDEETPLEQKVPDERDVDQYEEILTRARAWDAYNAALDKVKKWCLAQGESETLLAITENIREGLEDYDRRTANTKVVLKQFKKALQLTIREEIFLAPGQNEEIMLGREIAIFLEAIYKGRE